MLKFTRPVLAATAVLALGASAGAATTLTSAPAAEASEQASPGLGATSSTGADLPADLPEATPIATPPAESQRTKPIECGGYDEDGNVVNQEAAETDEVPLREDGSYAIPDFCHGYSEDGLFIGDD